jgi:protein SCO1/2
LLCYHYNPITGKYGEFIMTAVRAGGVATVLGIIGFIVMMAARDRRSRRLTLARPCSVDCPVPQPRDQL